MEIIFALIVIGFVMLLGFFGNFFFRKSDIPSIIWLLLFGLILGPITNQADPDLFLGASQFFAAIAIIIILFESGLDMDIYKLFKDAPRGLLLTFCTFVFSIIAVMLISIIMGFTPAQGLILGAIVGGTSSPIVIPIITKLKRMGEHAKIILSIETVITDVLCIVVALTAVQMVWMAGIGFDVAAQNIMSAFSIGIVIGTLIGLAWIPIMHRIKQIEFSYVVTLAFLFMVYASVEMLNGSGALACLMFGLVLGNGKKIASMLKMREIAFELDQRQRDFHSLISFFIMTFFFVYLGILVSIRDVNFIIIGIAITIALLFVRWPAVYIATAGAKIKEVDRKVMTIMFPRGLAAAVLAYLPYQTLSTHITDAATLAIYRGFADITFTVIFCTVMISTVGIMVIKLKEKTEVGKTSRR